MDGDLGFEVINDGIAAVAQLLAAYVDPAAAPAATARWSAFETRLDRETVPLALARTRFRLDTLELKCLVLGLAAQIEPRLSRLVTEAGNEVFSRGVTVRLAVDCFCASAVERYRARQAFLPSGRLVRHRLLSVITAEAGSAEGLLSSRLEVPTPTLRFLLGETELSESVAKFARLENPQASLLNVILPRDPVERVRELVEHHHRYRELLAGWGLEQIVPYGRGLTLLFSGPSGTGKTLLAQALAAHGKRPLLSVSASDLPEREGVEPVLRDLLTEATMRDAVVLVDDCEALFGKGDKRRTTLFKALEDFDGIAILVTNHPELLDDALERRIVYHVPFETPDARMREAIWELHLLPTMPLDPDIDIPALASRYDFTGGTIKNAVLLAVNQAIAGNPAAPRITMELLEAGCRAQLKYALEALAERSTTHLRLKDIVLPDEVDRKVKEILAACRNQTLVLNRWGFGERLATGKGIIALFDGPPGTGKTYCAEIIAGELDRPLYRINLPEVVSKWVGETEKHIKALFQQARVSHAMLLFDEADALFSSRVSETKSSTDRYANMEVNLLLQEVEHFPGICILTTNSFGILDKALVRRIGFRATFVEPDAGQRKKIWETLLPKAAPLSPTVDFKVLADRYELTGAQIKNSLLRAAYWAADEGQPIGQRHLMDACRDEYVAAGKVVRKDLLTGGAPASPQPKT